MSEEIRLPPRLLPREKHYRSERGGSRWWVLLGVGVCYAIVCLVFPRGIFATWEIVYDMAVVAAVAVILTYANAFLQRKRPQRLIAEYVEALALLGSGNVREAADIFESLCKRTPRTLPAHAAFVFSRGVAYYRQGNPDRALSLFAAVLESGRMSDESSEHCGTLLATVAMVYAVKGDIENAERWQGLAHDHVTPARAGMLLPMDLYLGIRLGRNEIVVKDVETRWADAAGILPGAQMQAVRVLCAFALSQKNPNNVRDAEIRRFLDGAWPCQPGQFDYLAVKWPELRRFLEENGLTNKPEAMQQ